MNFEDISWNAFKKTGDIDAFLLHKELENKRIKEWKQSKQEGLSQEKQNTAKQTVY